MRQRRKVSRSIVAFVAVFITVLSATGPYIHGPLMSGAVAAQSYKSAENNANYKTANNNVKALRACMAACRARTKACYASGNTGSCKSQHIACIAACQSSISSKVPRAQSWQSAAQNR